MSMPPEIERPDLLFVGKDQESAGARPHDVVDGLPQQSARGDHLQGLNESCRPWS